MSSNSGSGRKRPRLRWDPWARHQYPKLLPGQRTVGCPLLQFGWVKCREHISLLIILCILVYVTNKAHQSLICIVLYIVFVFVFTSKIFLGLKGYFIQKRKSKSANFPCKYSPPGSFFEKRPFFLQSNWSDLEFLLGDVKKCTKNKPPATLYHNFWVLYGKCTMWKLKSRCFDTWLEHSCISWSLYYSPICVVCV